jgi:hypothetical protein
MIRAPFHFFTLIVLVFTSVELTAQQYYDNDDFEQSPAGTITQTSQVNGWVFEQGDVMPPNDACNLNGCCLNAPAESMIIDCPINMGYVDPIIGVVYPLFSVFGTATNTGNGSNPQLVGQMKGSRIMRLNSSLNNYSIERATKTYVVNSNNSNFEFAFATVFATGHSCCGGGLFQVLVTVNGSTIACPSFSVAGPSNACTTVTPMQFYLPGSGIPWSGSGAYAFSKWKTTSLDLSAYIGSTVTVQFLASDCTAGGHYGYTYLDTRFSGMNLIANGDPFSIAGPTAAVNSCGASNFTLIAPPGQGPYSWNSGQIPIPSNLTVPNYTNNILVSNFSGTLQLTMNPLGGCGAITKTISLVVTPGPGTVTVNSSSICAGQSATLTANGANTYTWSNNNFTPSITVSPTITTNYTVVGADLNGCNDTAIASVGILPMPTVNVIGNPSVCVGTSANFVFVGNAPSYSLNGVSVGNTVSILTPSTTNYTVSCTNVCGVGSLTFNVAVSQTCADVWPGDANSDGAANNLDVLELGLHIGQSGPIRNSQGNLWQSYYASNWTGTITNGKNLCHSNCNGDGVINFADTLAIYQNYNLTHQFKTAAQTGTAQIYFVPTQSFVNNYSWAIVPIYLGDLANPIDLNGVAFTVNYETSFIQVDSIALDYPNSFLDQNNNLHFNKMVYSGGVHYTANTHTNNLNVVGNGMIANFKFKTAGVVGMDTVIKLNISAAYKSNANGSITPLSSGSVAIVLKEDQVGLKELNARSNVSIFPNPTKKFVTLNSDLSMQKLEICDLNGKVIHTTEVNDKIFQLNMQQFAEGIYFCKIIFKDKTSEVRKIVYRID